MFGMLAARAVSPVNRSQFGQDTMARVEADKGVPAVAELFLTTFHDLSDPRYVHRVGIYDVYLGLAALGTEDIHELAGRLRVG